MIGDYKFKTTFWSDFEIADKFGAEAVRDTYKRAFKEWKDNVEYFAELTLVVNWRSWHHYENGNEKMTSLYVELYEKASNFGYNHFKGKELDYFWKVLD